MEITELDAAVRDLRRQMDALQGTVRAQGIILRGKEAPGSGIPTWGARPTYKDSAQDGGGGGGGVFPGPGIDVDGSRVSVDLADDPGLEFDAAGDAGKLRVLPDGTRGLSRDANGVGLDPVGGAKYDVWYVNAGGGVTRGPLKLRA